MYNHPTSPRGRSSPVAAPSLWMSLNLRLLIVIVLSTGLGWLVFTVLFHEDLSETSSEDGIKGVMPGLPSVKRRRAFSTPAPVVKPKGGPSMVAWLGEKYNLRKCVCYRDWEKREEGESVCKCDKMCPSYVTPEWLTEAEGQALCSLESAQGYNCYAGCEDGKPKWFAKGCGTGPSDEECDKPILLGRDQATKEATLARLHKSEERSRSGVKVGGSVGAQEGEKEAEKVAEAVEPAAAGEAGEGAGAVAAAPAKGSIGGVPLPFDPKLYYDLRGLKCELLNGKETCFMEDEQGRELCPPTVTVEYLTNPGDQYTCSPEMSAEYYCTAGCQEGNAEVRWGANEVKWCAIPGNEAGCGKRTPPILRSSYKMQPWSEAKTPLTPCQAAWEGGQRPKTPLPLLSVGLLTHEPKSFRDSMETYEKWGLFDVLGEFMIFINNRRPEVEAVASEFAARHPTIRIMGSNTNAGILNAMNWLVGNASQPYFMFLERDFQLLEPATCVVEQLQAGVDMLQAGTAHVMRYRHKKRAGRPNWAAKMYKGKEDAVFQSGQPNLFCNHHYWYDKPEERWPEKIWICNKEPTMWCSDSFYCNWTNNPQMWSVEWWKKEYIATFPNFKSSDPYHDIESYMNWEPGSWNTRKWTVAQGQGLFKHVDRNNFGT